MLITNHQGISRQIDEQELARYVALGYEPATEKEPDAPLENAEKSAKKDAEKSAKKDAEKSAKKDAEKP